MKYFIYGLYSLCVRTVVGILICIKMYLDIFDQVPLKLKRNYFACKVLKLQSSFIISTIPYMCFI